MSKHPQLPKVVAVIFFLFTCLTIFNLWTYFSMRPHLQPSRQSVASVQTVDVARWHLFGQYDATYLNLPVTQLALVLQGTVLMPGGDHSVAIIMQKGEKSAHLFKVGQSVLGAVIKKIFLDRVVIEYDGTLQSLPMPTKTLPQITTPSFDTLMSG